MGFDGRGRVALNSACLMFRRPGGAAFRVSEHLGYLWFGAAGRWAVLVMT